MDVTVKSVKDMSPQEFRAACAALDHPQPRCGIDMKALEEITQGRKANELNDSEYRAARKIICQESYR